LWGGERDGADRLAGLADHRDVEAADERGANQQRRQGRTAACQSALPRRKLSAICHRPVPARAHRAPSEAILEEIV
jgi:hypothetical protein